MRTRQLRWIALGLATMLLILGCGRFRDRERGRERRNDPPPPVSGESHSCSASCGETVACTELGGTWSGGTASCRSDCSGYDVSACTRADADLWEVVKPATRDARWEEARCNDGTPFAYVVRLAPQPSSKWVIHLEGGVFCEDDALPCSERSQDLITTVPKGDRALTMRPSQGLFSRDARANPGLADANHVFGNYCSSDWWAGATTVRRKTTGDPAKGWYFSGHANFDSIVGTLVDRYGLNDDDPRLQVLLSGSSGGSAGAHLNVARLEKALPKTARDKRLKLFLDAGWWIDWDDPKYRIGDARAPDRDVMRAAAEFWGATLDPDCEARARDKADCLFGAGFYPHVSKRVPVLVQQCAIDASYTKAHGLRSSDERAWSAWKAQATADLKEVDWLFSGRNTSTHTLGMNDEGLDTGPPGATLRDVLARFLAGRPPERVLY